MSDKFWDRDADAIAADLIKQSSSTYEKRGTAKLAIQGAALVAYGKKIPYVGKILMAYDAGVVTYQDAKAQIADLIEAYQEGTAGAGVRFAGKTATRMMKAPVRQALAVGGGHEFANRVLENPLMLRQKEQMVRAKLKEGKKKARQVLESYQDDIDYVREKFSRRNPEDDLRNPDDDEPYFEPVKAEFRPWGQKAAIELLAAMRVLRDIYQEEHWNAATYGNHLLFERLYGQMSEDIDTWAELLRFHQVRVVGGYHDPAWDCEFPAMENFVIQATKKVLKSRPSHDVENFLMTFLQNMSKAVYLSRQGVAR